MAFPYRFLLLPRGSLMTTASLPSQLKFSFVLVGDGVLPISISEVEHAMEMFGDVRIDNYYWLRDDSRTNPDVLSYLRQENDYADSIMNGTKEFEYKLFAEIKGRLKEDDTSVPFRLGPYYYYVRTLKGKEYVQYCRRPVSDNKATPSIYDTVPTEPDAPEEHVILDENIKAQNHEYYSTGALKVSPNNKLVAYAEDTKGNAIYSIYVIDAETQAPFREPLHNATSSVEWAGDETLVYIAMDEIHRPHKAWLDKLGTEQSKDVCLYEEKDDKFFLGVQASESKKYLFVASGSPTTVFNFYLDVSKPEEGLKVSTPHVEGIDTTVSHRGNHFFIRRRSDEFFDSEVVACLIDNTSSTTVLLPHRESVKIRGFSFLLITLLHMRARMVYKKY